MKDLQHCNFRRQYATHFRLSRLLTTRRLPANIFITATLFRTGDSHSMFSAWIKSGLVRAAFAAAAFAPPGLSANAQQQPAQPVQEKPGAEKAVEHESKQTEAKRRVELNLQGETEAA